MIWRRHPFMRDVIEQRKVHWLVACLLVCAIADGVLAHPQADNVTPIVKLESGTIEGTHFSVAKDELAFLGVPYAAPPVGELRWKPPQMVKKWNGTRKATEFGAPCPQLPAKWFPYIAGNEDCLCLNVWVPRLSAKAKLPVLVYFHGGSNTQGYSQMTPLGPALSRRGLVVVSANYRLGPFGFLAHPALTAESEHHSSGNYGLLDQLQALRWVRDNISRFGGDPGSITVIGQSAGAVDICLLMASPMATGLFQRAIMESGDCQSVFNKDIRKTVPYNSVGGGAEETGERFASDLGVTDSPDALKKLRGISSDEILKAWSEDRQVHFDAIVDGWVIPEQPAKTFADGRQMRVPVLVGSNANEATVFGHGGPKTVDDYRKYLAEDTGKYADQEFRVYPASTDAEVAARYLQLQDDFFAYGAYSMARAMTRVGQRAYLYDFSFVETGKRASLGAYHGMELKFLSNSFPANWEHNRDDEMLGEAIRTYWTQFAKTGNPNGRGLAEWPAYDGPSDQLLDFGCTITVRQVEPATANARGDHAEDFRRYRGGKWPVIVVPRQLRGLARSVTDLRRSSRHRRRQYGNVGGTRLWTRRASSNGRRRLSVGGSQRRESAEAVANIRHDHA
jgi:para-nitrobenzyl esterase